MENQNSQLKHVVVLALSTLIAGYIFGRYMSPEKIVTQVKTEYVEKTDKSKDEVKNEDTNRHKTTTTVEITKPDGTKITKTKTESDTNKSKNTSTSETESTEKRLTKDETKTIEMGNNRVTISALGGIDLSNPTSLIYGAHVSKPLLGPICVGLWGFTDLRAGVSIGVQF